MRNHHTGRENGRSGAMLLEALIATGMLVLFAGGALMTGQMANQSYRTEAVSAELDRRAVEAASEVAEHLRPADLGGVVPVATPGTFANSIDFQRVDLPGTIPPSQPESFVFEADPGDPDDGVDNDSDGMVDEHRLVWYLNRGTATERTRVITSSVAEDLEGEIPGNLLDDNGNGLVDERGVAFEFQDGRIIFRMTLQRVDQDGFVVRRTIERTVALRNTPLGATP